MHATRRLIAAAERHERGLLPYLILILLGTAGFAGALWIIPTNTDDLIILSSVARTSNPFSYFWSDWGFGRGTGYRPLHSVGIWAVYYMFGVWALPNQLIKVILHIAVILLLFRFIRFFQPDVVLAFLIVGLSLFTLYLSPALWVSDRPTLFVALFLLMLLNIFYNGGSRQQPGIPLVVALCVLALMGKESGIIAPILVGFFAMSTPPGPYRKKLITAALTLVVCYLVLRLTTLGFHGRLHRNFGFDSGYIFGTRYYDSVDELSPALRYWALLETVLKNIAAPLLPVFDPEGGFEPIGKIARKAPFLLTLPILAVMATRGKPSGSQKVALIIVLVNAVVQYGYFRQRFLYVPQLAVSIYIATSPALVSSVAKRTIAKVLATPLLAISIIVNAQSVRNVQLESFKLLDPTELSTMARVYTPRIDNKVIQAVLQMYVPKNPPAQHVWDIGGDKPGPGCARIGREYRCDP